MWQMGMHGRSDSGSYFHGILARSDGVLIGRCLGAPYRNIGVCVRHYCRSILRRSRCRFYPSCRAHCVRCGYLVIHTKQRSSVQCERARTLLFRRPRRHRHRFHILTIIASSDLHRPSMPPQCATLYLSSFYFIHLCLLSSLLSDQHWTLSCRGFGFPTNTPSEYRMLGTRFHRLCIPNKHSCINS